MTHALHQQSYDDAGERRGVMRERPDQGKNGNGAEDSNGNDQTHFFVAEDKWRPRQQQKDTPPEEVVADRA